MRKREINGKTSKKSVNRISDSPCLELSEFSESLQCPEIELDEVNLVWPEIELELDEISLDWLECEIEIEVDESSIIPANRTE